MVPRCFFMVPVGFSIVPGRFSWFLVGFPLFHARVSWFQVGFHFFHGSRQFFIVPGGLLWLFMVPGWFLCVFFSQFHVGFSWFQVVFMVIRGSRSVFPGCRLVFMVFQGSRSVCHIPRWLFRVFHGPRPLFMISGCFYDFSWFLTFLNDSRLVFMVAIGWLISELSARGVKWDVENIPKGTPLVCILAPRSSRLGHTGCRLAFEVMMMIVISNTKNNNNDIMYWKTHYLQNKYVGNLLNPFTLLLCYIITEVLNYQISTGY